ncbi:MAG: hypothetical protein ACUVTF_01795 [bacterium]
MKYIYYGLIGILMIGCAQNARVEIGFNDGALLAGTFGDMIISVSKLELLQDGEYIPIWEKSSIVSVPINSEDFCSITNSYISIVPGNYRYLRITVDSLSYRIENSIISLIDSVCQFTATSFSEIIVEANEEYRFVVGITSTNWFDSESLKIKSGHQPFEGASLKVFY